MVEQELAAVDERPQHVFETFAAILGLGDDLPAGEQVSVAGLRIVWFLLFAVCGKKLEFANSRRCARFCDLCL